MCDFQPGELPLYEYFLNLRRFSSQLTHRTYPRKIVVSRKTSPPG